MYLHANSNICLVTDFLNKLFSFFFNLQWRRHLWWYWWRYVEILNNTITIFNYTKQPHPWVEVLQNNKCFCLLFPFQIAPMILSDAEFYARASLKIKIYFNFLMMKAREVTQINWLHSSKLSFSKFSAFCHPLLCKTFVLLFIWTINFRFFHFLSTFVAVHVKTALPLAIAKEVSSGLWRVQWTTNPGNRLDSGSGLLNI